MRIRLSYACIDGDKEDTGNDDVNDENDDKENSDEVCLRLKFPSSVSVNITVYCIRYNLIGSLIFPQGTTNKLLLPPLMLLVMKYGCKMYNLY